jgi:hypothetical protein
MRDTYYIESNMGSPSGVDARIAEEKSTEPPASSNKPTAHHNGVTYETTAEGDVIAVVQPSFDDHDGRSPGGERKSAGGETRSPPLKDSSRHPHHGHKEIFLSTFKMLQPFQLMIQPQ